MSKNKGGGGGGNKGGGGIKVAGVTVGKQFGAADIARIQEAKPNLSIAAIQQKAKAADTKIKAPAQAVFRTEAQRIANAAREEQENRTEEIISASRSPSYESAYSGLPGEEIVPFANLDLAREGANLQTQLQIERIRNAGATERLKYEVDNRIPVVQAEARGKIDLQKIVNAGYKNIANIERGTEMVRNITSMFNF